MPRSVVVCAPAAQSPSSERDVDINLCTPFLAMFVIS